MILTLALSAALLTPVADPPASKELFAKEAWYKDQKGKETAFTGVLQEAPRSKDAAGRVNTYRLEMGDKKYREVYTGGKDAALKPYLGYTVKFTGKAVDMDVEGGETRRDLAGVRRAGPLAPQGQPEEGIGPVGRARVRPCRLSKSPSGGRGGP